MRMKASSVVDAVVEALQRDVLPNVGSDPWVAGYIRASLCALRFAQDCGDLERSTLIADNLDMRQFLEAAQHASGKISNIAAQRKTLSPAPAEADVDGLRDENEALSILITQIIREMENQPPSELRMQLKTKLHECLNRISDREAPILARAETLSPI